MRKDYQKEFTAKELELVLEIIQPLTIKLSPENKLVLRSASTKIQRMINEHNQRNKRPLKTIESGPPKNKGLGPVNWLHGSRRTPITG